MTELLQYLITELTGSETCATIEYESELSIKITIDKEHMGKVIGKQGKIIKAIRTIVRATGMKENKKYSVEVVEREDS
ncbi:MAG: KH domain-containing protein [Clostridiales bacterium]|jgi:predicted RNA-binding protein YlqC (UPF0109 family)|nr:KH domain-containing protein [Clostridiales bacterium]